MKKNITAILMATVIASAGLSAMSAPASAEWVKNGTSYSYKENGKKLTGWQEIDGGRYYFDKNGRALTGKVKINGDVYYFIASKHGKMATSWLKINGQRYYFGNDGVMRTGWVKISGRTYYFGNDGAMRTGRVRINGSVYTFGSDGVLKGSDTNVMWGRSSDEVTEMLESRGVEYYWAEDRLYTEEDGSVKGYGFNSRDELSSECLYIDGDDMKNVKAGLVRDGYKQDYKETSEDGVVAYVYIKTDSAVITGYLPDEGVTLVVYLSPDSSAQLARVGYDHLEEVDM